ncbi:hypothetical protein CIP61R_4330002 [Escherichia coli]|nr:hypothetical protein CIP61R_4330002 [Escherichia coli]
MCFTTSPRTNYKFDAWGYKSIMYNIEKLSSSDSIIFYRILINIISSFLDKKITI